MSDPVMISSGITYERSAVEKLFTIQREAANKANDGFESDHSEGNFFKCPVTQKRVDHSFIRENKRIKQAVKDFIDKNPWAFEFNPMKGYEEICVWQEPI